MSKRPINVSGWVTVPTCPVCQQLLDDDGQCTGLMAAYREAAQPVRTFVDSVVQDQAVKMIAQHEELQ